VNEPRLNLHKIDAILQTATSRQDVTRVLAVPLAYDARFAEGEKLANIGAAPPFGTVAAAVAAAVSHAGDDAGIPVGMPGETGGRAADALQLGQRGAAARGGEIGGGELERVDGAVEDLVAAAISAFIASRE